MVLVTAACAMLAVAILLTVETLLIDWVGKK